MIESIEQWYNANELLGALLNIGILFTLYLYGKYCIEEYKESRKEKPVKTQKQIDNETFEREFRVYTGYGLHNNEPEPFDFY